MWNVDFDTLASWLSKEKLWTALSGVVGAIGLKYIGDLIFTQREYRLTIRTLEGHLDELRGQNDSLRADLERERKEKNALASINLNRDQEIVLLQRALEQERRQRKLDNPS